MAGIIERNARIRLTLKQRSGISDGKPTWSGISCRGFFTDMTQADFEYFGRIRNGRIFFVAPFAGTAPKLPAMIVCDGVEYEVQGIRTYRNLQGVLLGYRMAVAGGA